MTNRWVYVILDSPFVFLEIIMLKKGQKITKQLPEDYVFYGDVEELVGLLYEYLQYPSEDGRSYRQELRKVMTDKIGVK